MDRGSACTCTTSLSVFSTFFFSFFHFPFPLLCHRDRDGRPGDHSLSWPPLDRETVVRRRLPVGVECLDSFGGTLLQTRICTFRRSSEFSNHDIAFPAGHRMGSQKCGGHGGVTHPVEGTYSGTDAVYTIHTCEHGSNVL